MGTEFFDSLDAANLLALGVSAAAFWLSWRAFRISQADRVLQRKEEALRMIGQLDVKLESLTMLILSQEIEEGFMSHTHPQLLSEQSQESNQRSRETGHRSVSRLRDALDKFRSSDLTRDGVVAELLQMVAATDRLLESIKGNTEALRIARSRFDGSGLGDS